MSGVLRRFCAYGLRTVRLRRTTCTPRRKPLCGLAHQKDRSFLNWKLAPVPISLLAVRGWALSRRGVSIMIVFADTSALLTLLAVLAVV
jgi:hypothetical protein